MQEILITDINTQGLGVGRCADGEVVFVENALPGEIVAISNIRRQKKILYAQIDKIIKNSPARVIPRCQHFGVCGGCNLQHLRHQGEFSQIAFKEKHLFDSIERIGKIGKISAEKISPAIVSEDDGHWHYRRRARLSVRYVAKKERVLIGFHESAGRKIADLQTCEVIAKPFKSIIWQLADLLNDFPNKEKIAQVEIALSEKATEKVIEKATDKKIIDFPVLILRNLINLTDEEITKLKVFSEENQCEILLQPTAHKIVSLTNQEKEIPPHYFYYLPKWDLAMKFLANGFIQINREINKLLIERAIDWLALANNDKVADLFCGIGNFTLAVARQAKYQQLPDFNIFGIEGEEQLINLAQENAKNNQIENVDFFVDNLFTPSSNSKEILNKVNKLIIDPPRLGADEICKLIPENIKQIVYISCHPATLARDCEILCQQNNFQLTKISLVDMFPHTGHAEAIALFVRI